MEQPSKEHLKEALVLAFGKKAFPDKVVRKSIRLYYYQRANFTRYLAFMMIYLYIFISVNIPSNKSSNYSYLASAAAGIAGYLLFNSFIYSKVAKINSSD